MPEADMQLLERDDLLEEVRRHYLDASDGDGRLLLIGGEAGIGKTSLVRAFVSGLPRSTRVLSGACDPLTTPRPLGPFIDMGGGSLARPGDEDDPLSRWRQFLTSDEHVTVGVIEDCHWADEATLDVLRHVGRRLARMRTLLLVTFRDDEVASSHPLRLLLGDLAGRPGVHRLSVRRLSEAAVLQLAADSPVDGSRLYQRTAGNPFFVTEVLADLERDVPQSVGDAVLSRCGRLSEGAREAIEAAAIIGSRPEPEVVIEAAKVEPAALDECVDRGLLEASAGSLSFRHELARQAILSSIAPLRAQELNRRVLAALGVRGSADAARLAHHAELGADHAVALRFAVAAAGEAAGAGAHRQAAEQYERALRCADGAPAEQRAALLKSYAAECLTIGQVEKSVDAFRQAARLQHEAGHESQAAEVLARSARPLVEAARNKEADRALDAALALVEPGSASEALVLAIASRVRMLNRDNDDAVLLGRRAIALAEQLDVAEALVLAENAVGSALILLGQVDEGIGTLERSLEHARHHRMDLEVGTAYVNLGSALGEVYRFREAEPYLLAGIQYAGQRDVDSSRLYLTAWLAIVRMYQGEWSEATDLAAAAIGADSSITQIMGWLAIARVRVRRGDPDAWIALDKALALAEPTGTLQRVGPVRAARAEAAWLAGDMARATAEAGAAFELAMHHRHPWHIGELAWWLRLAGGGAPSPDELAAEPWAHQLRGEVSAAAAAWHDLGCPYEEARALAFSEREEDLLRAHRTLLELGARPMAAFVAARLREVGAVAVPRGARPSTRSNPAGLTNRELEVLRLLVAGLRNGDIAARLYLSRRTVDHHVSAILAKLGATSRVEAMHKAAELGISPN